MGDLDLYETLPANESYIGSGRFGWVKKVRRRKDLRILACKSVRFQDLEISRAKRECSILSQMRHPNVVQQVDEHWAPNKVKIYMEFYEAGSLQGLINEKRERNEYISERAVWSVFFQLASALVYCHLGLKIANDGRVSSDQGRIVDWKQVLHRDIKPANIFLASEKLEDLGSVKLGDFGLGYILQDMTAPDTYAGTPQYVAPEINRASDKGIHWTEHCDVFALGCTIYTLCSLRMPFQYRMEAEDESHEPIPEHFSMSLRALISACMSFSPEKRPSAYRIFQDCHPYLQLGLQVGSDDQADQNVEENKMGLVKSATQENGTTDDRNRKRKPKRVLMSFGGPEGEKIFQRGPPSFDSYNARPWSSTTEKPRSRGSSPSPIPRLIAKTKTPAPIAQETVATSGKPAPSVSHDATPSKEKTSSLSGRKSTVPNSEASIEGDALQRLKEYAEELKSKALDDRRERARKDREVKLEDLKAFAKDFHVGTPVPNDLVPILARTKLKQDEIIARINQQASLQQITTPSKPRDPPSASTERAAEDPSTHKSTDLVIPKPKSPTPGQSTVASGKKRRKRKEKPAKNKYKYGFII